MKTTTTYVPSCIDWPVSIAYHFKNTKVVYHYKIMFLWYKYITVV
jgi:hypothetical protein